MIWKLENCEWTLRTVNLLSRIFHFHIQGMVVGKVDKFCHLWPMCLLNSTISPCFCIYMYEMHFLIALDNFILTRASIWHKCRVNWSKIKQKRQDFYSSFNIAIKRRTKQNAATEGVSLDILEVVSMRCAHSRLRWGWKEKKTLYVKISLWKGRILASKGTQSKT